MGNDTPIATGLTDRQREAVLAGDGAVLVLAGAGSGKTKVITHRIAYLVRDRGVPARQILAVTFTNKAANEMRARAAALLDLEPGADLGVHLSTFHSFCARLLRRHGARIGLPSSFVIFDTADQQALARDLLRDAQVPQRLQTPRRLLSWISRQKNAGQAPSLEETHAPGSLEALAVEYQRRLRTAGALDFDDLLLRAVELLGEEALRERLRATLRYLLIDEYQDTNRPQYELVRRLVGTDGNVMAVGDEDQSIYSWRGADIGNILSFEEDFPGARVIRLEENFRSTQAILDAAGAVVAHNEQRKGKTLRATRTGGETVIAYHALDEHEEAAWVAERAARAQRDGSVAVLFRINAQSRSIEEALVRAGTPYYLVGGVAYYERREIKDALGFLRLLVNPFDLVAFRRVANVPARGIGARSLDAVVRLATAERLDVWAAVREAAASGQLAPRATAALTRFSETMADLASLAADASPARVLKDVLDATGYARALADENDPLAEERQANVRELLSAAAEFDERQSDATLSSFLDHVALLSATEEQTREGGVALMTLHSAKGLEFDCVLLVGLEEGLLPYVGTLGREADIEEERRLCYVGMTRARTRLVLTCALSRQVFGKRQARQASRFLSEIPPGQLLREGPGLASPVRPLAPVVEPQVEDPDLRPGVRVRHALFGVGTVLRVDRAGADTKLTVSFPSAGTKRLVARFAGLETL